MHYTKDHKQAAQDLSQAIREALADRSALTIVEVNPVLVGTDPAPAAALQVEGTGHTLVVAIY